MKAFEELTDQSRLWIYQSDRPLSESEQSEIMHVLEAFLSQWAAHGQDLSASVSIFHDHFLVIAVDESFNLATGCSIDQSFQTVKGIGDQLGIDFFNRTNIAFMVNHEVKLVPLNTIQLMAEKGIINENTRFFQNTIQTKKELKDSWLMKASESWLKKYFQKAINV